MSLKERFTVLKILSKKIFPVILTFVFLAVLTGCNNSVDTSKAMEGIDFQLVSKSTDLKTDVEYVIKMTNNSEFKIVQNNVLFSFINDPSESGETTNPFSILATDNKLNIKPGESVDLKVSFPPEFYEDFKESETKKTNLYFAGYLDELKENTYVDFVKSLSLN